MKHVLRAIGFSAICACVVSCGKDDDTTTVAPTGGFNLADGIGGGKVTAIKKEDFLKVFGTVEPGFMSTFFTGKELDLSRYARRFEAKASRRSISHGQVNEFSSCVNQKIDDVPVALSPNVASQTYSLDLIQVCDADRRIDDKTDKVASVSNEVQSSFSLTCAQPLGERGECAGVNAKTAQATGIVNGTVTASYVGESSVALNGDKPRDAEIVKVIHKRSAIKLHNNGSPCDIVKVDRVTTISNCTMEVFSYDFAGDPKDEGNSLTDPAIKVKPTIVQYAVQLTGMELVDGEPHFRAGQVRFAINNWAGTLTYQGTGAKSPILEAAAGDDKIEPRQFDFATPRTP